MARTLKTGPGSGRVSRLRQFAQMNLGVIMGDDLNQTLIFRKQSLDLLDQYYEGTQYDDLQTWDSAQDHEEYVPVRKRKPCVVYNLPKVLVDKVASKLIGQAVFPLFVIEDDPDATQFFRTVQKACSFRRNLVDPVKQTLVQGASFVRYYFVEGNIVLETASAKYCYPKFDPIGELAEMEIKYVFEDQDDKDPKGGFKKKWYRVVLTKTSDILYDNPEYRQGSKPTFQEVERNDHGLGWVQGEWLRTEKKKFDCDGNGLFADILDFIDDMNYSLSQSSQALGYNQEPQLAISGMQADDLESLIRSSQKSWALGKDGKAAFIESSLEGVKTAEENRTANRNRMLDVVRVVLHDPEKMVGNAQSGRALEVLNAPLVELVDELRTALEESLKNLLLKIGLTCLYLNASGAQTVVETPPGYQPKSLDVTIHWPPIFPPTLDDIAKMAQAANTLSMGNLISRESLTRWLASVLPNIDNVEEELQKIASQPPPPNPFGSPGGFE